MTRTKFMRLCRECEDILRAAAPYKTGNLRYNGIRVEYIDADTCRLYVDENIAPYMMYTNEPWQHGKNPNEGWFDRAAEKIAERIAQFSKGELHQS